MSRESLSVTLETESQTEETRGFIRQVRCIKRRKFTRERKIRIVMEGFRHEVPIRDLCRREGIQPNLCYAWLEDFMETGKEKLGRDKDREAMRAEVADLNRENERPKQLVAQQSLEMHLLKKPRRRG